MKDVRKMRDEEEVEETRTKVVKTREGSNGLGGYLVNRHKSGSLCPASIFDATYLVSFAVTGQRPRRG